MSILKRRALYYVRQLARQALAVNEEPPFRHLYRETRQHDIQAEIARLKAEICIATPDNPVLSGYKVFSQVDEDGILQALLARLPPSRLSRTAIEIGCADGRENNTHFLLLNGFRACWVDGSAKDIAFIRRELEMAGESKGRLLAMERFVSIENISDIVAHCCEFIGVSDPDVFSLDVDGNDLHILTRAIGLFRPKIVCVEYNGKFPPPTVLAIRYNPSHEWTGDDYQGASLQAYCSALADYALICCNISGANAFFVHKEYAGAFAAYPPAALFQPPRSHLRLLASGHTPSLKWLRDSLEGPHLPQVS